MKFPLLAALALAFPAAAQAAPDWSKAEAVRVTVTNRGFAPRRIVLRHGAQYVLRIHNGSRRKHNFSAPDFFRYARVVPRDAWQLADKAISVRAGQTAAIRFTAPNMPNTEFDFRSTVLADAAADLTGRILVN